MKEISRALGDNGLSPRMRCVLLCGGAYFENVKRVLELSSSQVLLLGKGEKMKIEGEGLSLGRCEGGDVAVLGDIVKVERVP